MVVLGAFFIKRTEKVVGCRFDNKVALLVSLRYEKKLDAKKPTHVRFDINWGGRL